MQISSKSTRSHFPLFGLSALFLFALVHSAWCAPVTTSSLAPSTNTQSIRAQTIQELETDTALQVKVSIAAKDQPLSDLLLDLQKQSKITLNVSPAPLASTVKVTAYIEDLPLSQVLLGLSRLYGVKWAKIANASFTMLPSDRSELEKGLLQLGDMTGFRNRFFTSLRHNPDRLDWPQEVLKYVNEQSLLNGAMPSVSALPADLLSKIRHEKEAQAALELVEIYQNAMEATIDDDILRVYVPRPDPQAKGDAAAPSPQIIVRTQDGQGVASLTSPPPIMPPKTGNGKKVPPPPTRNVPGPA